MTPMRAPTDVVGHTGDPGTPPLVEERRSLRLTRRQMFITLASMLVMGTIAVLFTQLSPPVYQTSRSIIVYSGSNANENDILSAAIENIVKSKGMAAEVKRRGEFSESIDEIAAMIGTERSPLSPYIDVVTSSPDKEQSEAVSAQVIPALRAVFESNQRQLPTEQRIAGPIFQEVFTYPLQSTSQFPWWFAAVFGMLLGGLVPYLIFLFRNLRKPVVASAQDVTEAIDLPVLVKIPPLTGRSGNPQDAVAGVISAVERLSLNEPIHRLALVGPGDGRERANLALALASVIARSFGQQVALIDADLSHGDLTGLVGAGDMAGLSECLSGQLHPDAALLDLTDSQMPAEFDALAAPDGMVRFLGAGIDRSRNILRMRSSLSRVLDALAGRYVVIINGPQIPGPVPTSQLLSLADATLMVVVEGRTPITDARLAGDALRSFAAGPSGVVVLRG
jgi:Mrp family chromosome partitioning ATPase